MLREIMPPTDYPSCGGSLKWLNQLLYCKSTQCGAHCVSDIVVQILQVTGHGLVPAVSSHESISCSVWLSPHTHRWQPAPSAGPSAAM